LRDRADEYNIVEQSDGPKRWIGRFLMENLLATAAVIVGR